MTGKMAKQLLRSTILVLFSLSVTATHIPKISTESTEVSEAIQDHSEKSSKGGSFVSKDILVKDLLGKTIDELIEVLGEPAVLVKSDGMMFGNVVWEFSDYLIETDFHPVAKPTINFLSFSCRSPVATIETVLNDLKLDEFNGAPHAMWNGALRWENYIAQEMLFERVTWYPKDRSLAIKK